MKVRASKIEIVLDNGIRCIITKNSDKKNLKMFEEASKLTQRRKERHG